MRKNHWFILFVLLLSFAFTACNNDNNEPQRANALSLNGENFPLEKGYILGDDTHYTIVLVNGSLDENLQVSDELTQYVSFEITSTATELAPGTYTFNPEEPAGTFSFAYVGRGSVTQGEFNDNLASYYNATSGTIEVSKNGDTYTLECTFNFGDETITVYYSGTLEARIFQA